jgi:D-alanyl-D-alanine carboxypeptidase/D-alanyl-D-alanine-endopeptidase (penicillin-binding protein 4)
MAGRPDFARYEPVLPILGVDGSLADVQSGTPAAGHIFAKTGTLVVGDILNSRPLLASKALGGYIDTKDGRHLAFSLMVNNAPFSEINDILGFNNDLGMISALVWAGQH